MRRAPLSHMVVGLTLLLAVILLSVLSVGHGPWFGMIAGLAGVLLAPPGYSLLIGEFKAPQHEAGARERQESLARLVQILEELEEVRALGEEEARLRRTIQSLRSESARIEALKDPKTDEPTGPERQQVDEPVADPAQAERSREPGRLRSGRATRRWPGDPTLTSEGVLQDARVALNHARSDHRSVRDRLLPLGPLGLLVYGVVRATERRRHEMGNRD